MRLSRLLAALAAGSLLLNPSGPAAGDPPTPPTVRPAKPQATRITLITGDQVAVQPVPGAPEEVRFQPGRGSRSRAATVARSNGHTYVIPSGVRREVSAGRLDLELFDVTTLLAEGYDDRRSAALPTIIEYAGSTAAARNAAKSDRLAGTRWNRVLTSIGARGAGVAKSSAAGFWRSVSTGNRLDATIKRIELDHKVRANLDRSVPQIGAPAAWQRGFTGRGVKVAILDTGIDSGHPDLAGKVATSQNFSESPDAGDHFGHGTHVAGTVAGSGAASGGSYRGVAPDAMLLNGKVLGDDGFGYTAGIIAGMEWAVAQGANVVNMSLGGGPSDGTDPISEAVNALTRQDGTLFVVAAGNCDDQNPGQISSPAAADLALAVANLERDGSLAGSSCRGPRAGDFSLKPEIAAPGSGIVAPRAAGTVLGKPVDEHYTRLTGTSMATPHVAGVAALLRQQHPELGAEQLKTRLMTTADPQAGSAVTGSGAGRVDADQATAGPVSTSTAELEFGFLDWPHPDPAPVTKTVAYHNDSTSPVTLDLSVRLDPGVTATAPTLSADQLVVPAGGEATVNVTARFDPDRIGHVAGLVTATPAGGGAALVTTFGWYSSPEEYKLTVDVKDFDGSPVEGLLYLERMDGEPLPPADRIVSGGTYTTKVPPGTYAVSTDVEQPATDTEPTKLAIVAEPEFSVGRSTTVALDARSAEPVRVEAPGGAGLRPDQTQINYMRRGTGRRSVNSIAVTAAGDYWNFFATPTEKPATGTASFTAGGRRQVPAYRATYADGGAEIPVANVQYGPRFEGCRTLTAVDAGSATPEELAGVRGKLAVIRFDHDEAQDQQLAAAERAGAGAVMFYDPKEAGIIGPGLAEPHGVLPVVSTSRAAATALLVRGGTRVRITGVPWSPVSYDLLKEWPDGIPKAPVLRPAQSEFARVDTVIGTHSDRAGSSMVQEIRGGRTPLTGLTDYLVEPDAMMPAPARRTSYLLGGAIDWSEFILESGDSLESWLEWSSTERRYRAGQRSEERWFTPVATSSVRDGLPIPPAVQRHRSELWIALSPFAQGNDLNEYSYAPYAAPGMFAMKVSRNGEPLGTAEAPIKAFVVPAGPADFTIELDAHRDLPWWRYSTRVRSVWDFHSEGGDDELLPLIAADVSVPQANLLNQVPTGKPVTISLGLRHQLGSAASRFTSARMEISYDGSHWKALPLTAHGDASYTSTVVHPTSAAGTAPSLRLTVADAAGGKLSQEVTRAYGLVR